MQSEPTNPSPNQDHLAGSAPPPGAPPPLVTALPPPLPAKPQRKAWSARQLLAILLSLCLGLFLADAVVSLVDDSLILLFDIHLLAGIRGTASLFAMLLVVVVYALMGLTPMVPKRLFLPLTLFNPVAVLVAVPFMIYFYNRLPLIAWGISFGQVIFGLSMLYLVQGGLRFRWPLVAESQLGVRRFGWRNLSLFLLANVFVLVPVVMGYLAFCAALAVDHFSEGFLALRPEGLTVQVRKYVRGDGKTIQLFPMSHIGEPDFYRKLSQSFPTNSIILMEGVTDHQNLLTNKITYQRVATSLGLAEQQKEFKPSAGKMVRADVDLGEFGTNTIACLNLAMLIHAKGVNADTLVRLLEFSPPHFEEELFDDLIGKRNRRLLEEIHVRLSQTENIIVPWGAAHMPGIAKEIQKAGFRLKETQEHVAIRFRSAGKGSRSAGEEADSEEAK